ncbi:uncharacterized protein CC84DRAFT_584701 [Paraphaeosphaeria sporulosa]|uniref:Amidohydrolase-related domain-containing protein n=1 Tax=Paraphaeosphaeria sporulosa TaxID=1460663 RepID=A0A177CMB0_9PLEO|nr:uncharacterized protein CC84DRAFT_584701 [Paraphaeosphaeria sporulosa]OAG08653.1 hypothetical protein CC84DRAFT_584701 [Paraphaeosphaeria sporulosa]
MMPLSSIFQTAPTAVPHTCVVVGSEGSEGGKITIDGGQQAAGSRRDKQRCIRKQGEARQTRPRHYYQATQAAVCSDTNTVYSMMASSSILLRGGILLVPDGGTDAVVAMRKDLLVVADRITCIKEDIDLAKYEALDAVEVDCSAKIVSPGFVDTHHRARGDARVRGAIRLLLHTHTAHRELDSVSRPGAGHPSAVASAAAHALQLAADRPRPRRAGLRLRRLRLSVRALHARPLRRGARGRRAMHHVARVWQPSAGHRGGRP